MKLCLDVGVGVRYHIICFLKINCFCVRPGHDREPVPEDHAHGGDPALHEADHQGDQQDIILTFTLRISL